jgi:hypothetical protein
MLNIGNGPLRPRVLIVDDAFARPDTALGSAAENLVTALESCNVDVARTLSLHDGKAIGGYVGVIGGAELVDGTYHVRCVKK